jgi:hypothetical protein
VSALLPADVVPHVDVAGLVVAALLPREDGVPLAGDGVALPRGLGLLDVSPATAVPDAVAAAPLA